MRKANLIIAVVLASAAGTMVLLHIKLLSGWKQSGIDESSQLHGSRIVAFDLQADDAREVSPNQHRIVQERVRKILARRSKMPPATHRSYSRALENFFAGNLITSTAELETIVDTGEGGAMALSDLSAAYLKMAKVNKEPVLLLRALASADNSLQSSNLEEARFNQALALEQLFLTNGAESAWRAYRGADNSSVWSFEADRHIGLLRREPSFEVWSKHLAILRRLPPENYQLWANSVAKEFPDLAQTYVEEVLLPDWARLLRSGEESPANERLSVARTLARELGRRGDHFLLDAIAGIDGSLHTKDTRRLRLLTSGYRLMHAALGLYKGEDFGSARQPFLNAAAVFREAGSPFADLATFHLAILDFYRSDYQDSFNRLKALNRDVNDLPWPYLKSRILSLMGLIRFVGNNPGESLKLYSEALGHSDRAEYVANSGYIHFLIARTLGRLGNEEEAWRHRLFALSALKCFADERRIYSVLIDAAENLMDENRVSVALHFYSELLAIGNKRAFGHGISCETLLRRGAVYSRLGRFTEALSDLTEARLLLSQVRDQGFRGRIEADIWMSEAEIYSHQGTKDSLKRLTAALEYFERHRLRLDLAKLLQRRSVLFAEVGQFDRAERDLDNAISEMERIKREIPDQEISVTFVREMRLVANDMINLQIQSRKSSQRSFWWAERSKCNELMRQTDCKNLALEPLEIQRALLRDEVLVEYSLLEGLLAVWVIDANRSTLLIHDVNTRLLGARIEIFRNCLKIKDRVGAATQAAWLYDVLIRQALRYVGSRQNMIVVPDGVISRVPFGALRDSDTNRYLVQAHAVAVAPTAQIYTTASAEVVDKFEANILAFGNPEFDRMLFPNLPNLPQAENEAQRIAALYPESRILIRREATGSAFLSLIAQYKIIHFSGHAVENERFPLRSSLLLAPSYSRDSGLVTMNDLYRLKLEKPRLIFLASCDTLAGDAAHSGVINLAESFIEAGVPAVVGTLWSVSDRDTTDFSLAFHRYLRTGIEPIMALQRAQLLMLASSNEKLRDPALWAAYQLVGS